MLKQNGLFDKLTKPGKTIECCAAVSKLKNMNSYNKLHHINVIKISVRVY